MLVFLLKSTACLTIFLAFYKLVLEKESIHNFKRFFLLGTLITSFLIPNIVFTEYVEIVPNTAYTDFTINNDTPVAYPDPIAPPESALDWEVTLWGIYALGVIAFGFRFIRHLAQIGKRIRRNPKFKENFIVKVLLKQSLPPHTFFNYIFLNQKQFEEKNIPKEVLLHEETHAKQRHSLDILFIELAQVLLWFNPIIYLFKSSIKLNHEFLADQAVIQKSNDHSHYQNTILSYLSHDSFNKHQSIGIANAINYSSIKKRFTVMKTNTSKKSFAFRSLLLLPLTALLLYGFSETLQIEKEASVDQIIRMDLNDDGSIQMENKTVQFTEIAEILQQDYLKTIDAKETKVEINVQYPVHFTFLQNITTEIKTTGIDLIKIFASEVIMEEGQYSEHIPITSNTTILKADRMTIIGNDTSSSDLKTYNMLANKYNAIPIEKRVIPLKDLKILETIYRNMDETQKENAQPFPECLPKNNTQKTINPIEIRIHKNGQIWFQHELVPLEKLKDELYKLNDHLSYDQRKKVVRSIVQADKNTPQSVIDKVDAVLTEYGSATINIVGPKNAIQQSATREEMKEYNTLAKKYNEMDRNNMVIKNKEVMRLKVIYGKMTEKQRADAEPFPYFPPLPPVPDAPKPPENGTDTEYASNKIENIIDTQDPYDIVGNINIRKPINPPAPPIPPTPLEHIKEMAGKGATFMFNEKEISAKEAIEIIQDNDKINIDSRSSKDNKPIVRLSVDPIEIDN